MSFRSFLPLPLRFSFRRDLLTEVRDILLFSLIPRRRVQIRFSRQIPWLQAAATSLFGTNPPMKHRATTSLSLSSTRFCLRRRTIRRRTVVRFS